MELEQELSFLARAAAEFYFVSLKFKSLFLIKTIYTKSYLTIFVLPVNAYCTLRSNGSDCNSAINPCRRRTIVYLYAYILTL